MLPFSRSARARARGRETVSLSSGGGKSCPFTGGRWSRAWPTGSAGLTLPRLWWRACSARAELRDWAETKRGRRRAPAQPTSKHQTSRPARGQSRGQLSSPAEPKNKTTRIITINLRRTTEDHQDDSRAKKGTNQRRKYDF